MKKKSHTWAYGILGFIITIGIILYLDEAILKVINNSRNSLFDGFFISITFASNIFLVFFLLTGIFLFIENKRRWILPLFLSGLFSAILTFLIKIMINRERPFERGIIPVLTVLFSFMKNNYNTWNSSFPSFQAVFVFASLPILIKEFNKLKYFWGVFACLVAFSRVYFGAHYLSDAFFGAILGYLIGCFMIHIEEKYQLGKKTIKRLKIEG